MFLIRIVINLNYWNKMRIVKLFKLDQCSIIWFLFFCSVGYRSSFNRLFSRFSFKGFLHRLLRNWDDFKCCFFSRCFEYCFPLIQIKWLQNVVLFISYRKKVIESFVLVTLFVSILSHDYNFMAGKLLLAVSFLWICKQWSVIYGFNILFFM